MKSFEKKIYSQNGEDGVIAEIFFRLGTTSKFYVEIGAGNGRECNTRSLREQGWNGLMLDKDMAKAEINLCRENITPENINVILAKYGVLHDFDLLSIDVDGNDFYLWNAINYNPRVVIIEYNAMLGLDDKVMRYSEDGWDGTDYFGASIAALQKLGERKGYSLIYAESIGVNLFFVQSKLAAAFDDVDNVKAIFMSPKYPLHKPDSLGREYISNAEALQGKNVQQQDSENKKAGTGRLARRKLV